MPHELSVFGVYISPLLVVLVISSLLAVVTVWVLNYTRLSRYLRLHQWIFFVIIVIYGCLLGRYWTGV